MKAVIILGSSRSDGDTSKVARQLADITQWDLVDLNDYKFSYYDYLFKNKEDDFIPLMKKLILNYDVFVFATPVYWYSMSGIMKVFFDRITDLLDYEKDLGRKLRGKKMAAVSVSVGDNIGEHFWLPFSETAKYLGMNFITGLHTIKDKDATPHLKLFTSSIKTSF